MDQWTVRRLAVTRSGSDRHGITAWGLHVDGCLLETIRPHIEICLEAMGLTVERIAAGSASPFFTVLGHPSRNTPEAMHTFETLMAERKITGPYCDVQGRAKVMEYFRPAKIAQVERQGGDDFAIRVVATSSRALGRVQSGFESCKKAALSNDGRAMHLVVEARNEQVLARHLRLAGNMMSLRWSRDDPLTLELLSEPLL